MDTIRDTICAVATAAGNAGIGIIRLSGPESVEIADRIFRGKKRISEMSSYTAAYGKLVTADEDPQVLDEAVALLMRGPHSYTTEDVVELSCHGGILMLRRVMEELVRLGARMAEPGEFTKRAFLGGRIDLTEAEAVMDIISAENDQALKASMHQLQGGLREEVASLRETILYETAYIESALDDPENYSLDDYGEHLMPILSGIKERISKMCSRAREGRFIREGIRTAIVGRPNAGKSSLLNLLLGEDRAIVTEIAGTTRDTLEERTTLGGVPLVLVDTAGIRNTEDRVEQIGVERARREVEGADLIFFILDSSTPLTEEDEEIAEALPKNVPVIVLLNKQDLDVKVTPEDVERLKGGWKTLLISAVSGEGRDELVELLRQMFFRGELSDSGEKYLLNTRHVEALTLASEALDRVEESVEAGVGEDFYTIDLLAAYESLGRITGETLEDDLADKIFAEFCLGK